MATSRYGEWHTESRRRDADLTLSVRRLRWTDRVGHRTTGTPGHPAYPGTARLPLVGTLTSQEVAECRGIGQTQLLIVDCA